MSLLNIRAGQSNDTGAHQVVERFFDEFAKGRFERSSKRTAEDFTWFGKKMGRAQWASPHLAKWVRESPIRISKVRSLSKESLEAMPKYAIVRCFGALENDDAVIFADVSRGGSVTTAAVVVSCRNSMRPVLKRVLDPETFVNFADFAAVLHHVKDAKQKAN